jgi:hypothetical protein
MGAGSVGHHFCVGQALFSVTRIGHLDVTSTEASGLVTPTAVARDSSCRSVSVALISRGLADLLSAPVVQREPGSASRRCLEGALGRAGVSPSALTVALELGRSPSNWEVRKPSWRP